MKTENGMDLGYVILLFVIFIGVIAVLVKEWERRERRKCVGGKQSSNDQKRPLI